MQQIAAKSKKYQGFLPVALAFIIPVAALTLVFILKEIYPFGDEMYLRSDMYHQYAMFLKEFQNILKGSNSLLYSWNIGLGSGFSSTYAYYLATPLYWLIAFIPYSMLTTFMDALIVLKAGLMSAAFVYYLNAKFERRGLTSVPFGIFYALSAYMAAYSWNLMWLDCLVLFPLILLGLERLVKERKFILYTVSLAICIFTNYYIAIMICIFLVFYFVYLMICEKKLAGAGDFFRTVLRFSVYSVLAGLICAALLIPTIFAMGYTGSLDNTFPTSLYAYHSLLETLTKALMCMDITMISGHQPNIYCGAAVFLLVPLYWINNKIRIRERIGKTVLLAILLFSFTFNIPAYIWHGFHYPNSLPARHSFIYIAILLLIAYEALLRIRQVRLPAVFIVLALGALAVFGLYFLYPDNFSGITVAVINAGVLALYAILYALIKNGRIRPVILVSLLIFITAAEAAVNSAVTGYGTTSHSLYYEDDANISAVLNEIPDDDGFYRVEKEEHRTKNDGAWMNYMSASIFSSATNAGVEKFYEAFGLQASFNSISYYGHTPLVTAALGVEYEISKNELDDPLMTLFTSSEDIMLYRTDYVLSAAYMVNAGADELFEMTSDNPFEVQNSYVNALTGTGDVFHVQESTSEMNPIISLDCSGRTYIYLSDDVDEANVIVQRDNECVFSEDYDLSHRYMLDLGELEEGDEIFVSTGESDEASDIVVCAGVFDYDAFFAWFEEMKKSELEISEFDTRYISGNVSASEDGILLTSIPYDKGWTVYVDGIETATSAFAGAFLEINLAEGDHTVEFRYFPEGLLIGAVISILALLIFILLCVIKHLEKPAVYAGKEGDVKASDPEIAASVMNSIRMKRKNSEKS